MSPITRTFTRAELDALDLPGAWADDAPEILHREQVETRRWVSVNELIFRAPDDGKPYRVHYEEGLTEVQEDHDAWNYDDTVTATLMEQHETTVTQWREVVVPTHEGPDPSHGGLTTHRGTREQCTGPDCGPAEEPISRAHVVDYDAQTGAPECVDDCPGCGLIDPNGVHDGTCEVAADEQPAAPVLSDSVRQFLTFALNCAAEEMDDRCDEFDDADEAALDTLRRIANGAPVPFTAAELADAAADVAALDAEFPDEWPSSIPAGTPQAIDPRPTGERCGPNEECAGACPDCRPATSGEQGR